MDETSSTDRADGGAAGSPGTPSPKPGKRRVSWRPWLRALHRDLGYLAVGLTIIYALSGLAVNHVADWDPSFTQIDRTHRLTVAIPDDDEAAAKAVLGSLGIGEKPTEVYRVDDTQLDVVLAERTLHVDTAAGTVAEEGQRPRFFLRLANWLHLNRGKKAWTVVADSYAVVLLVLSISGLFMLPGKKGLRGRGAIIALVGAAIPAGYVVLSGGPQASSAPSAPAPGR